MKLTTQQYVAVNAAAAHLVHAFKQVTATYLAKMPMTEIAVSVNAPTSYEALYQSVRDEGVLLVSPEHSDTSIYGKAGNIAFRTMHDLGHVFHALTFSLADEVALFNVQWIAIQAFIPTEQQKLCRAIYDADTTLMSLYEARHGEFPKDQTAFVSAAVKYLL